MPCFFSENVTEYYRRRSRRVFGGASERNEKVPVVGCCLLVVVCCVLFVVCCLLVVGCCLLVLVAKTVPFAKLCLSHNYCFVYEKKQVTLYEKQREWEAGFRKFWGRKDFVWMHSR